MKFIPKNNDNDKKATAGCKNPYKYAKTLFSEPKDAFEEATVGCEDEAYTCEDGVYTKETPRAQERKTPKTNQKSETPKKEQETSAFSAALRILQAGANSRRMLREKLMRKGFDREKAEEAVEMAVEEGLLNERRLFFSHLEFLARRKYYGKSRLRLALMQKFDRETVEEYFEEAADEIDFEAYAKELVRKNRDKSREALIGKLKRNGYNGHEIREALTEADEETF